MIHIPVALNNLSGKQILTELKKYFVDEELDEVSAKLDTFIIECGTIEDLVNEINDYFIRANLMLHSIR